jgi:hypothetical protein
MDNPFGGQQTREQSVGTLMAVVLASMGLTIVLSMAMTSAWNLYKRPKRARLSSRGRRDDPRPMWARAIGVPAPDDEAFDPSSRRRKSEPDGERLLEQLERELNARAINDYEFGEGQPSSIPFRRSNWPQQYFDDLDPASTDRMLAPPEMDEDEDDYYDYYQAPSSSRDTFERLNYEPWTAPSTPRPGKVASAWGKAKGAGELAVGKVKALPWEEYEAKAVSTSKRAWGASKRGASAVAKKAKELPWDEYGETVAKGAKGAWTSASSSAKATYEGARRLPWKEWHDSLVYAPTPTPRPSPKTIVSGPPAYLLSQPKTWISPGDTVIGDESDTRSVPPTVVPNRRRRRTRRPRRSKR